MLEAATMTSYLDIWDATVYEVVDVECTQLSIYKN